MNHVTNKTHFNVRLAPAAEMNRWLAQRHYLHRPMIRTKLLAHEIMVDNERVGGVLWSTPHFTKKRNLFGFDGLPDKWEVLMLARFYLSPNAGLIASAILAKSIGKSGRRLQNEWCELHPPVFPENPFVPRLLISWSDLALETIDCEVCGATHIGQHEGIIYQASGWKLFDTTQSNGQRTGTKTQTGEKRLWVRHLPRNKMAERIGLNCSSTPETASLF